MAERQVVLVREAQSLPGKERLSFYLEHPQTSTVLIFCHKHGVLDKRKKLAVDMVPVFLFLPAAMPFTDIVRLSGENLVEEGKVLSYRRQKQVH